MITDKELYDINAERQRKGLRPLSRQEAEAALQARRVASLSMAEQYHRDTSMDFLIGLTTGIPMPSSEGVLGVMLHDSTQRSHYDAATSGSASSGGAGGSGSVGNDVADPPNPDPAPSYSAPDPSPSPSFDSSPSPSFDSGGGSSPGGGGGE